MARYDCERPACGEALNTLDPPHLCKDVAAREREALRRATTPCQGTGSLEGWLKRMEHYRPTRRTR